MIITEADLPTLRARHASKRIVFAIGTFDMLHYGHVQYITRSKQHGDILVVAVNDDLKVRHHKGHERPIIPEADRMGMVDALRLVDYTVLSKWRGGELDSGYWRLCQQLRPDVICISRESHHDHDAWRQAVPGAMIVAHDNVRGYGTTDLIHTVIERHK